MLALASCVIVGLLLLSASVYIDVSWKGYPLFASIGYHLCVIAVVIGALAILAAAMVSRMLTSPLTQLTAAAQALARGNFDQRVAVRGSDEVGQMAVAFNSMAEDLQRSEQQRRQALADIAHELRNPLSPITTALAVLRRGRLMTVTCPILRPGRLPRFP